MPTGYTYPVVNGEIDNLADFALNCARAFGALIHMRDEPNDAPVPDEVAPSPFYAENLDRARARLASLRAMTIAEVKAQCDAANAEAIADAAMYAEKDRVENERLDTMAARVEAWQPPTPDHAGLKAFMLEQLRTSRHSGPSYAPATYPDATAWFVSQVEDAEWSVTRCEKDVRKEIERAAERTAWIRALRASLTPTPPTPGEE